MALRAAEQQDDDATALALCSHFESQTPALLDRGLACIDDALDATAVARVLRPSEVSA